MYCTAKKKLEESLGHLHKEVTNHSIICKERKSHFFSLLSCSNRRGSLKCRGECQNLLIRDLFSKICHSCPPLPPSLSAGGGGGCLLDKKAKEYGRKIAANKNSRFTNYELLGKGGFFRFPRIRCHASREPTEKSIETWCLGHRCQKMRGVKLFSPLRDPFQELSARDILLAIIMK